MVKDIFYSLMSLILLLLVSSAGKCYAQTYQTVELTGFNEDIIANGNVPASQSTSNDIDDVGNTLLAQNFTYGGAPSYYLPNNGLISSINTNTPGLTFQLADYSDDNSLRLNQSTVTSGELDFVTPVAAQSVYVLGTVGNGLTTGVSGTYTVHFTDGTTQTFSGVDYPDWTYNTPPYGIGVAITNIGQTSISNNSNTNVSNTLFQRELVISAVNYSKHIDHISISATSWALTTATLNLMAVSVKLPPCPEITFSLATPAVACYGGSSLLSASASITGSTLYWYSSETGGAVIDSGGTFQTPDLTHHTTYYVSATYNGCSSDPRTPVNIDVQSPLIAPHVLPADTLLCSGSVATLRAVKGTAFDTATIGTGTNGYVNAPVDGTKAYSQSQLIYTQAEMGSIGSFPRKITDISFYKTAGATNTNIGSVQIYMSYTSASLVGTTLPNITTYTLVYNGSMPNGVGANNWVDIPLTTAFPGPGAGLNQNLSIVIIRENQPISFINAPRFAYTDMTNIGYRCGYNSGSTVLTTALTQTYNRPNIKLSYSFQPDVSWTPVAGLFKDNALANQLSTTDTNSTVYTNVPGTYQVHANWQGCSSASDSSLITILPPIPPDTIDTTICLGESFTFNGQTYTASTTLTDTFQSFHGCDSVVGLNLTVLPTAVNATDTISGCWSIVYDGQNYASSTLLSDTLQYTGYGCDSAYVNTYLWVHPADTQSVVIAVSGCNSAIFEGQSYTSSTSLLDTIHNQYGCDSVYRHVHITVYPPVASSLIDTTICHGESFTFNGQTYTASTTLTDTFQSVHGCDSVVGLNVTVLPAVVSATDTISGCWSIVHNGQSYTSSTLLSDTLHFSGYGCDSAYLNTYLWVHPVDTQSVAIAVSGCSSVIFEGQSYTSSTSLSDTIHNQYGCDSVYRHVQITVYPPVASSLIDTTICHGESFTFNGQTYTASTTLTDTFQSVHGCDSIVGLNLTILPAAVSATDTISGCWSIVYDGQTYTASTLLSDTLPFSGYGCDSAYLNTYLWVHPADTQSVAIAVSGCSSALFEGQSYTSSTSLLDTIHNQYGCDSVYRHVQITVYPPVASSLIDTTICHGESFTFNGQPYTVSTTLTDTFQSVHGCDSIVGLNLTVLPAAVSATDTISGCWSIVHNGQNYTSSTLLSDTLHFSGYGCDSAYVNTYLWIHPADTQSVTIDTAGCGNVVFNGQTYTSNTTLLDTISNQYGCDSVYRHVHITVYNTTLIQRNKDTVACDELSLMGHTYYESATIDTIYKSVHGCDSLLLKIRIFINHSVRDTITASICRGASYLFNGQEYRDAGVYSASYPYWNGCDSTIVLVLQVHELPDVTVAILEPPVQFCEGNPVVLQAGGAMSYHWLTDYGKDYGEGDSMSVIMVKPDIAVMTIGKDVNGCADTTITSLHAEPCCTIFMPNAFTPNGDGKNDLFGPGANGSFSEYRLEIYDRYGKRIFVAFNKDAGWDGTIGGKPAAVGTYFYRVMAKCMNGSDLIKQGDLTLMR